MKKYFLSFILLLTLLINNLTHAAELTLYSQDGFEVTSEAFIVGDKDQISLVKDSDLLITFIDPENKNKDIEPDINLTLKNELGEVLFSLKSPSVKMNGNSKNLNKYLEDNKLYFNQVSVSENKVRVTVPLKFVAGKYDINMNVISGDKKSELNYSPVVSDSYYSFTNSDIILEDSSMFANIDYVSYVGTTTENIVTVSLTQGDTELFKKEFPKTFYDEGVIAIDEKIEALDNLKGQAALKVEVRDKEGKVILSQTKSVNITKSGTNIYYLILGILILLLIILFLIIKNKKIKISAMIVMLILIACVGFLSFKNVNAVEYCGGVAKPDNECVENKVKTWVCLKEKNCDTIDARLKKFFSLGNVMNIASPKETGAAVSVSVNICTNISQTLTKGDNFYVISDSGGSDWQRKKYHIFRYEYKTASKITFDPGGDKRNVNYAEYNGDCTVKVYGDYKGDSSNFREAKTTIVEVGRMHSGVCKSNVVTNDTFEGGGNMIDSSRTVCSNGELRDTYIAGSVYINPIQGTNAWQDKTVNVCSYLGYTASTIPVGKNFYALMEENPYGSWTMIRFPVFAFEFGKKNVKYDRTLNGSNEETVYYYDSNKQNTPTMRYDGSCNVTFRLYNYGDDTKQWGNWYKLIELGMVSDATCKAPVLTRSSDASDEGSALSYKYEGGGHGPDEIESDTKNFKYNNIAPFFEKLGPCGSQKVCSIDSKWIPSYTNTTCGIVTESSVNGVCGTTNNVCTAGTLRDVNGNDTPTQYKWDCLGSGPAGVSAICSATKPTVATNGECSLTNANICLKGTLEPGTSTTTASEHKWNCLGLNGGTKDYCSISITPPVVVSTSTGGTLCSATEKNVCLGGSELESNTIEETETKYEWSCVGPGPSDYEGCSLFKPVIPPTVKLTKTPKISLNKNGSCTIDWTIENMPSGAECRLSGWGIDGGSMIIDGVNSIKIDNLQSNQKYTLSCSGSTLDPAMTASVICRVNPDVKEN